MGVPKRNIHDDELVQLYRANASLTWLAQYYNCHPATIRRHLPVEQRYREGCE